MMRVLGVPENQLEAVSYGKEKRAPPAAATDNAETAVPTWPTTANKSSPR